METPVIALRSMEFNVIIVHGIECCSMVNQINVNIHGIPTNNIEVNRIPSLLTLNSMEFACNNIEFNGIPWNNIESNKIIYPFQLFIGCNILPYNAIKVHPIKLQYIQYNKLLSLQMNYKQYSYKPFNIIDFCSIQYKFHFYKYT